MANKSDEENRVLASGSHESLENYSRKIDGFPHGYERLSHLPWLSLAIDAGSFSTVKWMLDKGVDPNLGISEGCSSLHSAIDNKSPERYLIIDALIKAKADLEVREHLSWTPLQLAAARNDVTAVKLLLEAGARLDVRGGPDGFTAEEEADGVGACEAAEAIREWRSKHE